MAILKPSNIVFTMFMTVGSDMSGPPWGFSVLTPAPGLSWNCTVSVEVPPAFFFSVNFTGFSGGCGGAAIMPSVLPLMLGSWLTCTRLMSSNAKIAFEPSKVPSLAGSAETRRTPLPMRSAVRFRSASFTPPPGWPGWVMPGIMAFIAPVFTRVVCSTVPLPSGFTLIRVELLMQRGERGRRRDEQQDTKSAHGTSRVRGA